jgi:hypothetical protein
MKTWLLRILLGVGLALWCAPATAQTAAPEGKPGGSPAHGWILDGRNRDLDFSGNNRTGEFSRLNTGADDGTVRDASAGAGYAFAPGSGNLRIIPLAGYSYHQQNPAAGDGKQTGSLPGGKAGVGLFSGLDSTYEMEGWGPWIGLDLDFRASDRIMIFSVVENHWDSVTILIGTTYHFNW